MIKAPISQYKLTRVDVYPTRNSDSNRYNKSSNQSSIKVDHENFFAIEAINKNSKVKGQQQIRIKGQRVYKLAN